MAYTKAELEALKNTLLASLLPIPASNHRTQVQSIIDEMFDAQTRGDLLSGVTQVTDLQGADLILIIRNGLAKLAPLLVNPLERVTVSVAGGTITMNMASVPEKVFVGSADISANRILAFTNETQAIRATLFITVSGTRQITMPSNVKRDPSMWTWLSAGPLLWEAPAGTYKLVFTKDGTSWLLDIYNGYTDTL